LTLSTEFANDFCYHFDVDQLFACLNCTRIVHNCAVDSIDHNPSASSAMSSFHGTSFSLMQQTTTDNAGEIYKDIGTVGPVTGQACATVTSLLHYSLTY
jgi:hypothetical protein